MPGNLPSVLALVLIVVSDSLAIGAYNSNDLESLGGVLGRHQVTECLTVVSDPGSYELSGARVNGSCSLFLFSEPTSRIVISPVDSEFLCSTYSEVTLFDGWVIEDEIFPSESEHEKPIEDRMLSLCKPGSAMKQREFVSSQNALTIHFSLQTSLSKVTFDVQHEKNPKHCHQIATEEDNYLLLNRGQRHNCTLLVMGMGFSYNVESLITDGIRDSAIRRLISRSENALDGALIGADYLEIGRTNTLSSVSPDSVQRFTAYDIGKEAKGQQCFQMFYFRLVSSGFFLNQARLRVHTFTPEEMQYKCLQ